MPTYNRSTTVDPLPGGDSVKQACIDLDTDLTAAFTGLNTLDTGKAPLASPALTGTPTAPTATAGTNTTQVATTAFVKALGDTKSPVAGPGSTQAFEVGALSASTGTFTGEVTGKHIKTTDMVTVSTTPVELVGFSDAGGVVSVGGFNLSGGAQQVWLLLILSGGASVVATAGTCGLTVTFSMSGNTVVAQTSSGSVSLRATIL